MGKKKAPKYATTTYDTGGLFGSSTNSSKGTTYNPSSWISNTINTVGGAIPTTLSGMLSNDYSNDPNFQAYQNNFNRQMTQAYDSNVLSQLANRGLMRSSGLQSATNAFNDTMANNEMNLYDQYYNRQANNLANLLNTSNSIYSYITGLNSGALGNSQAVNQHNIEAAKMNDNSNLFGAIANAAGNIYGQTAQNADKIAMAAMMASDINVKKNIKKIGEKNGYNWYEFEYKDGLGLPEGKQEGVIAQEVEKVNPEAVTVIDGIKHVDYSKL